MSESKTRQFHAGNSKRYTAESESESPEFTANKIRDRSDIRLTIDTNAECIEIAYRQAPDLFDAKYNEMNSESFKS